MIIAHISFTAPAYKNNIERKTKAIPATVSPLILSNSNFLGRIKYKKDFRDMDQLVALIYLLAFY